MPNRKLKRLLKRNGTHIAAVLVIVAVISVLGVVALIQSHAATPFVAAEAESGTLTAPAAKTTDSTASGGSAVTFAPAGTGGGCAAGQTGTPPNCFSLPPAPLLAGKTSWDVPFSEEFNGTDYDHTKLSPCFDWAGSLSSCNDSFNQGREHYQPSQVQVSNGSAKLVAEPLSPPLTSMGCNTGKCTYKSGMVSTARLPGQSNYLYKFTYGYVESRMKFPGTQGFFTAFWMLPADPTFSYRSEIDIVEILGNDPKTVFMTYHYNNRSQSYTPNSGTLNNGACAVKDYSTDWVTFGMDWEPSYIAWYINGVKCGQFNGNTTTIENGPMQLIVDLMVDHQWQRDWGVLLKDPTLTRQMELDYLRVYQQH